EAAENDQAEPLCEEATRRKAQASVFMRFGANGMAWHDSLPPSTRSILQSFCSQLHCAKISQAIPGVKGLKHRLSEDTVIPGRWAIKSALQNQQQTLVKDSRDSSLGPNRVSRRTNI